MLMGMSGGMRHRCLMSSLVGMEDNGSDGWRLLLACKFSHIHKSPGIFVVSKTVYFIEDMVRYFTLRKIQKFHVERVERETT